MTILETKKCIYNKYFCILISIPNYYHFFLRNDLLLLKEGEEEKTKIYSALCVVGKSLTESDLNKLNNMVDVKLSQKTPIRVLHRFGIFFFYCIITKVNQYCILLSLIK